MKTQFIFNDISTFLIKKKLFNFYTNIVGTIRLSHYATVFDACAGVFLVYKNMNTY